MHSRAERSKNGVYILQAFHRGTRGQCRCSHVDQTPLQMSQVRVLLVDAAVVILETQTVGSSAITLIPSSLPPTSAALHPPDNQSVYTLDGCNSKSQNSTSALESLRLPSNNDDDDAPVSEAADPRPTTTPIPFPAIFGIL